MANQKQALTWVLEQSRQIQLTVQNLSWIQEPLPGWTDIHCSLFLGGRRVTGRGAASSEDHALCKAVAEAFERIVVSEGLYDNSNGFAAHLTIENARINASLELLERDLFLCHFLTWTPFLKFQFAQENWGDLSFVPAWAAHYDVEVNFYQLGKVGVVCIIDGVRAKTPFGISLGMAARNSIADSATAAFIEAARNTIQLIDRKTFSENVSIEKFLKLKNPRFIDHGRLALNIEYANKISVLFRGAEKSQSHKSASVLAHNDIAIENIPWENALKGECPFVFARASSPKAQKLWVGETTPAVVNMERLRQFSDHPLEWKDINYLPHPFD